MRKSTLLALAGLSVAALLIPCLPSRATDDPERILQALRRFTFGPRIGDLERVQRIGLHRWFEQQLDPAYIADPIATRRLQRFAGQTTIASMRATKLMAAIYSERQLQEVMVDFWFNHFNVDARKVDRYIAAYERDVIRPHALGTFPELLRAVASSPAMLDYLDNSRSSGPESPAARAAARNGRPPPDLNENYGRELLELHTLGVDGGYTQHDVVEAARIFSGWTIRNDTFFFDVYRHDDADKVVLGRRFSSAGQAEGEQLLDFLATHPVTAEHIAWKLCRRFISDDPPRAVVYRVAAVFAGTKGDIKTALREIFTSPELYTRAAWHAKTKSPLEAVVSSVRAVRANISNPHELVAEIGRMGEPLYHCVPPTGYGDRAETWISSGTLLARIDFASRLCHGQINGANLTPLNLVSGVDARRWPDVLTVDLLGHDVSAATQRGLREVAATGADVSADRVSDFLSLLLGSPEFQKR